MRKFTTFCEAEVKFQYSIRLRLYSTMLLNWCCSRNILNAENSVGSHGKKFITLLFFKRIKFYLAVKCKRF